MFWLVWFDLRRVFCGVVGPGLVCWLWCCFSVCVVLFLFDSVFLLFRIVVCGGFVVFVCLAWRWVVGVVLGLC